MTFLYVEGSVVTTFELANPALGSQIRPFAGFLIKSFFRPYEILRIQIFLHLHAKNELIPHLCEGTKSL
jgi:hypothetical protein